jgi:hypothetical protein
MMTGPICNAVFEVVLLDCNVNVVCDYKPNGYRILTSELDYEKSLYSCSDK